jgi:hypothetical protein
MSLSKRGTGLMASDEKDTEIKRLVSALVEIRSTLWRGFEDCDPDAVITKAYARAHKLASDALNHAWGA